MPLFLIAAVASLALAPASSATGSPNCGDVLTTSAVLTADLVCSGNGLTIAPTAGVVTVDLSGHSILGSGGGVGIAVNPSGTARVIVKSGSVKGFQIGVQLDGVGSARIDGLTIRDNDTGVSGGPNGGPGTTLANSAITHNRGDGVSVAFIRPFEMNNDRVNENGGNGIFAFEDSLTALRNTLIARNGQEGLHLFNSVAAITGNTFFANGSTGLAIFDTICTLFPFYVVSNNTAVQNGNGGMTVIPFTAPDQCPSPSPPAGTGNVAHDNAVFQCHVIVCRT